MQESKQELTKGVSNVKHGRESTKMEKALLAERFYLKEKTIPLEMNLLPCK